MSWIRAAVVLFVACLAAPVPAGEPEAARPIGLEIVLAVDASASISKGALAFQLRGHAAAFRDPDVIAAAGFTGVAATLAVFSGPHSLHTVVPWTRITGKAEAEAFAAAVESATSHVRPDATALGSAIADAAALFTGNGIDAPRKVIDIVSNGFNNAGPDPATIRDRVARRGITVNALAILDDYPWLESYYAENVIGGPGAFVKTAMDRDSFTEALRQKLLAEIAGIAPQTRLAGR